MDLKQLWAQRERCWRLLKGLTGEHALRLKEYCIELDRRIKQVEERRAEGRAKGTRGQSPAGREV